MKQKVFWVTRDKDDGGNLCLWERRPQLEIDGIWLGRGKDTEPNFMFDRDVFAHLTGIKLKEKEIKKCRIEIVEG